MTSLKHFVKVSLIAAFAASSMGSSIASAQDGVSHPSPFSSLHGLRLQPNTTSAPTTTYSGTAQVTFNVTVKSAITTPILCLAEVYVSSYANGTTSTSYASNYYTEDATATASRTGNTATCTVNIPYQWSLYSNTYYAVYHEIYSKTADGTIVRSSTSAGIYGISLPKDGKIAQTINVTF